MYVTVRRYTLAGSSDELIRRIKAEYVPIITALPGFKAYHVVDCGGHETMSISFWETKIDAVRASGAAREWISKSALGLAPFPPKKPAGRYGSRYRFIVTQRALTVPTRSRAETAGRIAANPRSTRSLATQRWKLPFS